VATGTGTSAVTTITFAMQSARYIRVTQTGSVSGIWWSIDEFNAFGMIGALPAAPAGLTAVAGNGQVVLSWNAAANATGYNVKQATVSGGLYTTVATNLPFLTYTNTGLANGTLYYFVVSATNSVGESANSIEASARPVSPAQTPLNFVMSSGQIQFSWPMDHTGWHVQIQTNSLNAGIGTHWVTVPNSNVTNQFSVPINPTSGNVFFRLVFP
jgi:hypothetical protein